MDLQQEAEQLLLYRDAMMLVINKPSGIAVHKGMGKGPNLDPYLQALHFGLPRPPALAHRLDRDTSGCLILGRHTEALRRLGKLFEAGKIDKTYWAVVLGTPNEKEGRIDLPLAKQENKSYLWRMKVDAENGQPSSTEYRVLSSNGSLSWLELKPLTGRTHQLRVHCAAMGFPIVGDKIYGNKEDRQELCLHAYSITVPLYDKKPAITVTAPCPPHIQGIIDGL